MCLVDMSMTSNRCAALQDIVQLLSEADDNFVPVAWRLETIILRSVHNSEKNLEGGAQASGRSSAAMQNRSFAAAPNVIAHGHCFMLSISVV
jgi:hypothetical protein